MDIFTKEARSQIMKKVKGKNTSLELMLRKALWSSGIRGWRLSPHRIKGKPDLAFIGKKVAVFVDGCFWHGCSKCYRRPKSNQKYWDSKIAGNRKRDRETTRKLRAIGWVVIRVWEHELKSKMPSVVRKIQKYI
ncbi:very short patch repair endonuclease [Planctomycetota bacterium]